VSKAETGAPRPPTRGGAAAAAAPVVRTAAPQRGGGASAAAAEEARQAEAKPQHRGVGSVTGTVALPRELHHSRAEEVARRVYDTLAVASVEPRGDVFTVAASSAQVVDQACLLLDTLVAQQLQLQRRFGLKDRLADDVSRVQAEIEAGLRCEFNVDPNLLGLVIGPGGAHVRRVTEETQVDRIVIDRQASVVRIVGHRPEDVARAREMLEVCCLYIPLPEDKVGFVVGKEGRNINDIIARSGLVAPGGMTMDRSRGAMRVQGTRAACEKARLLIEAQLDFLNQAEREQVEVEAMRQKLEHMQTNWGEDSTVVYRGGGGHGGAAHSRGGGGGQYRGRGDSDYHR
jgi:KH domain